jgi:adenylate kinase
MPLNLIIVGPPGSGKGTLCENISRDFHLVHLSGGELLREEVTRKTALGLEAFEYMKQGKLIPDDTMVRLMMKKATEPAAQKHGILLDGFPRTLKQAQAITAAGMKIDAVIVLDVSDKSLLERSAGRRVDPVTGEVYHLKFKPPPPQVVDRLIIRPDDTEEKQLFRMKIYKDQRDPLLVHFKDLILMVNADQPIPTVYKEFLKKLKDRGLGEPVAQGSKL